MLPRVRIVLVEPTHPGNIGASARAIKNMGLSQLYLVNPLHFPSADATSRAAGADDLLESAVCCSTLQEALSDCQLVIGASARVRGIPWPELTPKKCAQQVAKEAANSDQDIAILFGREHSGLTNQELDTCQFTLKIPCNPAFSSLNIAAAVQLVAYELFVESTEKAHSIADASLQSLASANEIELFYTHLYETLRAIEFIHPDKSKSIMRKIRRLFTRTRLEKKEIDIMRGILSSVQKLANKN